MTLFRSVWEYNETYNGELFYWYNDSYADGTYTYTDENGTEESEMTADDYYSDIYSVLYGWVDTFDYGRDYTLTHESEYDVVTYTIDDEEIISLLLQSYVTGFSYELSVEEADSVDISAAEVSMYFWPDGMMIGQSLTISADLDFQGTVLSFDLTDFGEILIASEE